MAQTNGRKYPYARGNTMLNKKTVSGGLFFAIVTLAAINLLPDFLRYMRIRSM